MLDHARVLATVAGSLILSSAAIAQPAAEGGRKLMATLTGAAEVPAGDPDGSGMATFTVNPGQRRICYTVMVSGIATPTAAHIHIGAAGTAPPNNIVVPLEAPADGDADACADVSRELALAILKDPSNYYINVHNADYPTGALRGQLMP
jgi:hypothetical protein